MKASLPLPPGRSSAALFIASCAFAMWSMTSSAAPAFDSQSPWMTGDWGGLRSELLDQGVDIKATYTGESASLLRGGYDRHAHATRYADQFRLAVDVDLEKYMGWQDMAFSVAVANRNGDAISSDLDDPRGVTMGSTQEIYGRGSVTRLSQLWLSKGWFDDRLNVKAGRFAVGDEFGSEDCYFQNVSFCGSQPGNFVDSIYNGPISMWALRVRYRLTDDLYAKIGAFNVNPSTLENDNGFKLNGAGTTGTHLPIELVWTPGFTKLPGEYRVGYYRNTVNARDVYNDEHGNAAALTGENYRMQSGRHGFWVVGKQQLTSVRGDSSRGLTFVASATFQDRATTPIDSYQKVSLLYQGPFDSRPVDTFGIGVARMHASSYFLRNAKTANAVSGLDYADAGYVPEQHSQYVAEINYGVQLTGWLKVMPNLQYIRHPDGIRAIDDALVFGLQVQSQF